MLFLPVQLLDDRPLAIAVRLALLAIVRRRQRDVRFDEARRLLHDRLEHVVAAGDILAGERQAGDLIARGKVARSDAERPGQVRQRAVVVLFRS